MKVLYIAARYFCFITEHASLEQAMASMLAAFHEGDLCGLVIIIIMATLWFLLLYLLFFPRLISAATDWMSTILPQWCGLSANLGCRSKACCTRLTENTGCKKFTICAPSHNFVGLYLRN